MLRQRLSQLYDEKRYIRGDIDRMVEKRRRLWDEMQAAPSGLRPSMQEERDRLRASIGQVKGHLHSLTQEIEVIKDKLHFLNGGMGPRGGPKFR